MSAQAHAYSAAYDYAAENKLTHAEALWELASDMDQAISLIIDCPCCKATDPWDAALYGTGGYAAADAGFGPIPDDVLDTLDDEDRAAVLEARRAAKQDEAMLDADRKAVQS